MSHAYLTVPFYEHQLILLGINDEPMVVMKPVVESMGLSWQGQQRKIQTKFRPNTALVYAHASDGKNYEMLCLSLRKLPAWLYSISPNKVKPEIRNTVILYQKECDEALWRHWQNAKLSAVM